MFVFLLAAEEQIGHVRLGTINGTRLIQAVVDPQNTLKIHDTAQQVPRKSTVRRQASAIGVNSFQALEFAESFHQDPDCSHQKLRLTIDLHRISAPAAKSPESIFAVGEPADRVQHDKSLRALCIKSG